jgi:hypothetical protein
MADKLSPEDAIGCTLAIFWLPAMLVGGFLIKGYVLAQLWAWFVVTKFAAPPLSVAQAIGLAVVVAFLTKNHAGSLNVKKEEKPSVWKMMGKGTLETVLPPLCALLTGYIVSHYV